MFNIGDRVTAGALYGGVWTDMVVREIRERGGIVYSISCYNFNEEACGLGAFDPSELSLIDDASDYEEDLV